MVVPRNLNDSTAVTELFMMVSGVLSVFSSRLLRLHQTASCLTSCVLSRLVTVLDEADQCGVVCKLQELDGGVFRCAVVHVQGEEQWGENIALRISRANCTKHVTVKQ